MDFKKIFTDEVIPSIISQYGIWHSTNKKLSYEIINKYYNDIGCFEINHSDFERYLKNTEGSSLKDKYIISNMKKTSSCLGIDNFCINCCTNNSPCMNCSYYDLNINSKIISYWKVDICIPRIRNNLHKCKINLLDEMINQIEIMMESGIDVSPYSNINCPGFMENISYQEFKLLYYNLNEYYQNQLNKNQNNNQDYEEYHSDHSYTESDNYITDEDDSKDGYKSTDEDENYIYLSDKDVYEYNKENFDLYSVKRYNGITHSVNKYYPNSNMNYATFYTTNIYDNKLYDNSYVSVNIC
jgi:hypothetical protein